MRIISGEFKGKKIFFLKSVTTRPLKDSVKENIFNILIHSNLININLEKSYILDLYSGVGSFGLECISRGANNITFVEKDKSVIQILNKNLLNLMIQNKAIVENDEIINFLNKRNKRKFDIIFFDPPFKQNFFIHELQLIHKKKIYKNNHIVVIHRERNSDDNLDNIINTLIVKNYGRSKVIIGKFLG